MMGLKKIFIALFVAGFPLLGQNKDVTVTGDKLLGKVIGGESVREVIGNVVITQSNVRITCGKAVQFLSINKIELFENVVITQDSIRLKTQSGYYFSDQKYAYSNEHVELTQGTMLLTAGRGEYFFDDKLSVFYGGVYLRDSTSTLHSEKLRYFKSDEKMIAYGNVEVVDLSGILHADSLLTYRDENITFAYDNVSVYDEKNELTVFGDYLEDRSDSNYSKVSGDAFLMQVDSSENGERDTLWVAAKSFETWSDTTELLVASDSVKILRGNFSSVSKKAVFWRAEGRIEINRESEEEIPPVLWNDNSQLVGDSVNIYLKNNSLDSVRIFSEAFILSRNKKFPERYDQISGNRILLKFNKKEIKQTDVRGNALSIYYTYDKGAKNGLIKSSAERTILIFEGNEVSRVKMYGDPISDYNPENLIEGKESEFSLPSFIIYSNKPSKKFFLDKFYGRQTKTAK